MPWGRLDDSLYDHPKLDALGRNRLPCVGLNTLATSWCNRFLTDGLVPTERVFKLGGTIRLADCLVTAELWERVDGGYRIHDFLDYNDSAESVRRKRSEMRELGKRGGERSGEARRSNRDASTVDEPQRLNSRPVPSIPYPSRPSLSVAVQKEPRRDPEIQRMLDLQEKALAERRVKP